MTIIAAMAFIVYFVAGAPLIFWEASVGLDF